jgi:uncharacterized protein (TIGR02147 family)
VEQFDNYIDFLQAELIKRIKLNPSFSQRAFAKLLGMSPGSLSEIMAGKRKLTYKNALKIASKLGLSKIDTKNFVLLLDDTKEEKQKREGFKDRQLSDDVFSIISNWYCFAILNLVDCVGFKWGLAWISKRLGISLTEAKDAIERMKRVGLIEQTDKGLRAVDDFVLSPDGISSQAVRSYHHSILQKAQEALENQPVEEREISGISFAVDPKNLDKMKKDIDDFQRELIDKYCKGKRTEVYHLELALFKLTK